MNWSLFAGFLAITLILMLTPGPVVTLVISTVLLVGVSDSCWAAAFGCRSHGGRLQRCPALHEAARGYVMI